jgi:lycopene cyclase domain-containing protein
MKEYTICAILSALVAVLLDRGLGTRLLRRGAFWIFLGAMFCFKLLVNGYLTWRPIVRYGEMYYLGVRLGTIPVEDFLYGFSLITVSVVMWEYFRRGEAR